MKISTRWAAVALVCALGAHAAHAADVVSASSSITGLTFRLIDLDTSDGITPSIQFNNNHVSVGTAFPWGPQIQSPAGTVFNPPALTLTDSGLMASTENGIQTSAQLVSAEIENENLRDPATYNGSHFKAAVVQSSYGTGTDIENGIPAPLTGEYSLTLSANTALVIEGFLSVSSQVDGTQLAQGSLLQGVQDNAYSLNVLSGAVAYLELYSVEDFGAGPVLKVGESAEVSSWLQQTLTVLGLQTISQASSEQFDRAFSIQLSNSTSANQDGVLKLFTGSQGIVSVGDPVQIVVPEVPVIPEPGTWALMGLGLGLMGWRVRATRAPRA